MSKYKTHQHGLTFCSQNWFSHTTKSGELLSFPCMLVFEHYYFQWANPINCFIDTPAIQLCWEQEIVDGDELLPYYRLNHPRPWFKKFLDEQCPGWSYRNWAADNGTHDRTLFLQKYGDMMKIKRRVDWHLEGMRVGL